MGKDITSNGGHNSGIYTVVRIECIDERRPMKEVFKFHLPRKTIDAELALRDRIFINRVYDIPDENCTKHVTFYVHTTPKEGFYFILRLLDKRGIPYDVVERKVSA